MAARLIMLQRLFPANFTVECYFRVPFTSYDQNVRSPVNTCEFFFCKGCYLIVEKLIV